MPPQLKPRWRYLHWTIIILCVASLIGNAFLVYRWQIDQLLSQALIAGESRKLEASLLQNGRLTKENFSYKEDIAAKEAELAKKQEELTKKQEELTTLGEQLESKKKELSSKQAELTAAQKQINDQKSQLDANSSELAKLRNRPPLFSFQNKSSSLSDIEAKKEAVKQVVTAAYDTIESVYGKPYLLHSVTISFVDSFSNDNAAGEIVITNSDQGLSLEIRIKDFDRQSFNDVNTIIHEIIHSFHGLAVLEPTAFEEGITVAATDAVMKKMIAAGSIPAFSPLYIRISESQYTSYQSSLSIPRKQSALYGSPEVATMYQVLGKAWYKLYEADSGFFNKFNEKIYAKKQAGQEITEQMVLDTIREVQPSAALSGAAWNLK